ncbi:hypothetical protein ACUXST_001482 [Sphingomonas sp. F9_3S_D5_B_2]
MQAVRIVARYSDSGAAKALFWSAALFAFVMAVMAHPPQLPGHPSDKIEHMAAFAVLGVLGSYAYPRVSALRLIVGLSVFGAIIEVAQAVPSIHRDSDPLDWFADTFAATVVILVVRWWRRGKA